MSPVTTKSGQARSDLIAMFETAQRLASVERERSRACRTATLRAISDSTVREQGDYVHVVMPRTAWDDLRRSTE